MSTDEKIESNILPEWKITITSAANGFVLEHMRELDSGHFRKELITVTEPHDGDENVTMRHLLYEIMEFFGHYNGITVSIDVEEEDEGIKKRSRKKV